MIIFGTICPPERCNCDVNDPSCGLFKSASVALFCIQTVTVIQTGSEGLQTSQHHCNMRCFTLLCSKSHGWSILKQELMKAGGHVVLFHSIDQIKWSTAEFVMNCAHKVHLRELERGIGIMCFMLACNLSHFFVRCLMDSILNWNLTRTYGRYGKEQPQGLS